MRYTIAISGPAGTGIFTAGLIISELLAKYGYYIYVDKEYDSIIKGGNNTFVIYISDEQCFISKKVDVFFYFDKFALDKNLEVYDINNTVFVDNNKCTYQNTYSLGMVSKLFGINLGEFKKNLESKFEGEVLEDNLDDLKSGFDNEKIVDVKLEKIGKSKILLTGNEILAKGAISGGLGYYSAYPMTPASTIIDEIVKYKHVEFFQGEDEIAVSMSMLGANFTGKKAMCATSGGGFALMSESISFSNQVEIGGVWILSQRDGPSTGTPTYTAQGDLKFALNPTFGDTHPIVIAPSDYLDAYYLIASALNWAKIYQLPIIFLVDKQFSESYFAIEKEVFDDLDKEINKMNKKIQINKKFEEKYKRYEFTTDGLNVVSHPGDENGEYNASSYEHDEYGATNEDPKMKKKMMEKKFKKTQTFVEKEFDEDFYGFEVINSQAKRYYITFGINRLAIESLSNKEDYGLIVVKVIEPLDKRLKEFLEYNYNNIEELVFVEGNYSGLFEDYIRNKLDLKCKRDGKVSNIRKFELYPFWQEEF